MLVELDKEDLISLICGTDLSYELMDGILGSYSSNYDRWIWDQDALEKLSEEGLLNYYKLLKSK